MNDEMSLAEKYKVGLAAIKTYAMSSEYIKMFLEYHDKLRFIAGAAYPEETGHYFLCGEAGEKDTGGLPDIIFVCASYGSDYVASYKKVKENDS